MSQQLPDVQATQATVTTGLDHVGFTDVEKYIELDRGNEQPLVLLANFDVSVNLPQWRKGVDMSRNLEAINETLEAATAEPAYRIEDICGDAAERLLSKHEYTTNAEVQMEAEFLTHERTPTSDQSTQRTPTVLAKASATDEGTTEEIGARVTGITVCPCSQGMSSARARDTLTELGIDDETTEKFLERVPQPGHSQRGHATLTIQTDGTPEVDVSDLIDIARDAMSARIYNLAKRSDEDYMTVAAHENAKFVEDCVRDMSEKVVQEFPDLSPKAIVNMKQTNDESIHQHNAHAERTAQIKTLRKELQNTGTSADGSELPPFEQ